MNVSAIVRAYNRAYIIQEALRSIAEQTYAPLEIIVVDDGSADNTEEVVRAFGDPRVRYLRHEKNRGVAAACNTGIEAARGDLIAFLDSDDIWKPEYLATQVQFLKEHPGVGAVFTDTEIYENGTSGPTLVQRLGVFPSLIAAQTQREILLSRRSLYLCLLQEVPIKPSALVMRKKDVAVAGRFDESWRCGEDWEFLLRLVEVTDFGFIHAPLVVQRQFADATHRLHRTEDKFFLLNLFTDKKSRLAGDHEALVAIQKGISTHCKLLGWSYTEAGNRFQAAKTYLRGFVHTGEIMMLGRALGSYLPLKLRAKMRGLGTNA